MTYLEFKELIYKKIVEGKKLSNPGGGTSIIDYVKKDRIKYIRKNSHMYLSIDIIYKKYKENIGKALNTNDLKEQNPEIFDSAAKPAGHSCNCTFLFMVLKELELVDSIKGLGKPGNPFYIEIYSK